MKNLIIILLFLISSVVHSQGIFSTGQSSDINSSNVNTETVNATVTYQFDGVDISWGTSTVARTGLTNDFTSSYVKTDSLTLTAGTYCITYSMQVNFLTGSGTTTSDYAYMDIYDGSASLTNSEIYETYPYTTVGVGGEIRTMSWNVTVAPSVSTKYYFRIKHFSNTGLVVKLKGYVMTAIKVK